MDSSLKLLLWQNNWVTVKWICVKSVANVIIWTLKSRGSNAVIQIRRINVELLITENKTMKTKIMTMPHGAATTPGNTRTNFVQQNIRTFLNEVSIGGARYTVLTSASFFRRLFWLILMLFGIGFCVFQIIDRVQYYIRRPTIANIKINHVQQLRFPTVTICNENRIVKSKLLSALGQYTQLCLI
jgi:hypothetical protein